MGTIASSNIQIFPLAKPRATNLSNRLFYENNVAAIIRQITSNKSFIVDAAIPDERATAIISTDNNNIVTIQGYNDSNYYALEFNIYGYRIQIQNQTAVFIDNTNLRYLIGKLKVTNPSDANLTEVNGQDANGLFNGFEIISSDSELTDTATEKYLILFEKDASNNSKYNIYEKSLQLFTSKSVDMTGMITGIDGKR